MQKPTIACVECGKQSTYWLCSNACALAYAKKRGRRNCAICSYDEKTGRVGRHDTTQLCPECRSHQENCYWVHRECEEPDELIETRNAENLRLREQQDRPLPEVTPLLTLVARLVLEGERVPYLYTDRHGHKHKRYRWQGYTIRRLAKRAECAPAFVQRVVRSIEK